MVVAGHYGRPGDNYLADLSVGDFLMVIIPNTDIYAFKRPAYRASAVLPVAVHRAYGADLGQTVPLAELAGCAVLLKHGVELVKEVVGAIVAAAEHHADVFKPRTVKVFAFEELFEHYGNAYDCYDLVFTHELVEELGVKLHKRNYSRCVAHCHMNADAKPEAVEQRKNYYLGFLARVVNSVEL